MALPVVPGAPIRVLAVRFTDTYSLIRLRDAARAIARTGATVSVRQRAERAERRYAAELRRRGERA